MPPSWHPVPACTPRLCCRRAVLLAGTMALQAEPFYFAAKTLRRRNHSTLQQRPYAGGPFYFAATKIGIGRRTLLRRGQAPLRRLCLRIMPPSWQPVPACASNGHSAGGQFINAATTAAGGPFNTATTIFRRRNYSSLRQRKLESDAHRCDKYCCRRAILL